MTIEQKIAFIENYKKSKNAASGSKYDANANVTDKNIASLAWEVPKKDNIDLNREMMIRKLDEKYGDGYSKKYIADLNSHIIYKHDETGLIHPYCCSISMYPFLLEGLQALGGTSTAPKNTNSFCGSFINLCFLVSSQFMGALACSEFLTYLDYFLRKDYGDDYYKRPDDIVELGNRTRTIEQKITDYFQQVVYSINQPAAARGYQSIFLNIAYFDKYYFESIFEGFYFPDGDRPQWNSVSWLQKKFMKWFNQERTKAVLTFPVETLNLLTDENGYRDKEWADFAAEMLAEGHSFFIYRSNSVDALASCCFSKDQKVLTRLGSNVIEMTFEEAFKNKITETYYKGNWVKADVVRTKAKKMFEIVTEDNDVMIVSEDHLNCTLVGDKRTQYLTTEDSLLLDETNSDKKSVKIKSIKEAEYKDEFMYCFEMKNQNEPYFTLPNNIITHNCRLRNAVEENTFSYTLGAGAIQTGSKGVITMNLNRIVQDWYRETEDKSMTSLSNYLAEIVKRVHVYLSAFNDIIWDDYNAGLLTVFKAGFIDLDKQYLTLGM